MPEQHPLTVEVLSAHLDYLLDRVTRTIQEVENLRNRNRDLASRLETCREMHLRVSAERDEALEDVEDYVSKLGDTTEALRLACQDLRGPGVPTDDLVKDYLRAATPTSVEDRDA